MRKFYWMLLVLMVLVGCSDESTEDEEKAIVKPDTGPEKEIIWEKDGKEMVVIPTGDFRMGDSKGEPEEFMEDATRPVHTVELDAFYMDIYEVTVGQFIEFVNQSGYKYDGNWNDVAKSSPGDWYPMIYVSWNDAVAYCDWAGKRLPTDAEWEYAARGGLVGKRYPGGDEISHDDANYSGAGGSLVGSFAANGNGLSDMAGNVYEWCQGWYGEDYYSASPVKNPPGPDRGKYRVLRGGSWHFNPTLAPLHVAYRTYSSPDNWNYLYGFRCVVSGSDYP